MTMGAAGDIDDLVWRLDRVSERTASKGGSRRPGMAKRGKQVQLQREDRGKVRASVFVYAKREAGRVTREQRAESDTQTESDGQGQYGTRNGMGPRKAAQ
jgi:hypothetical protein